MRTFGRANRDSSALMPWSRATLAAMLTGLLVCPGCGEKPLPTYQVKGKVTLDGAPLEQGDLIFYDLDDKVGPDRTQIVKGTYQLKAKAGNRRVEISSTRDAGPKPLPGKDGVQIPDIQQLVAPEFNRKSTLKAEIKPKNDNKFDFDVKSDPKTKKAAGK